MHSIEEIKRLLRDSLNIVDPEDATYTGTITNCQKQDVIYYIYQGWDICKANDCDKSWGTFNLNLIEYLKSNYTRDELVQLSPEISIEDSHWNWVKKSASYSSENYSWFFLYADEKPQAACLIYHPKASLLNKGNIFYIEYVAVAPWNRANPISDKQYSGMGSKIIQHAMAFAREQLGLEYGFSLHSLPKARGFYEKIGMEVIPEHNEGNLSFYEFPMDAAKEYMEDL